MVAVGYYFRFNLSYRDVVEILRDRGITVHHTTIMRWVHHYGPIFQVLWRRQRLADHFAGRHGAIAGADHFWFGHTPLKRRYDSDNQHYIDTGAVFGGELTLVALQLAD